MKTFINILGLFLSIELVRAICTGEIIYPTLQGLGFSIEW